MTGPNPHQHQVEMLAAEGYPTTAAALAAPRGRAAALDIADGIEGVIHLLDCDTCPEVLARTADQWRTEGADHA